MITDILSEDSIWNAWKELSNEVQRSLPKELTIALLLSGQDAKLQMLDCLYQTAMTSAQFGQYQRAVQYLLLFRQQCERIDQKFWEDNVCIKYEL